MSISARFVLRETLGVVALALLLFLSAGRWDWGMGWALVGIVSAWAGATAWILIGWYPELIPERMGTLRGAKAWDRVILGGIALTTVARCVVAGLDQRWGWSTGIPLSAQLAATAVATLGYALLVWATSSNAFFSQVVRIQVERGHAVATGGPYRFVRHPAYVGTILFELAAPVMLGSWWAVAIGALAAILFVVRTALEDRTLRAELDGYRSYAARVRYRLLPGVW